MGRLRSKKRLVLVIGATSVLLLLGVVLAFVLLDKSGDIRQSDATQAESPHAKGAKHSPPESPDPQMNRAVTIIMEQIASSPYHDMAIDEVFDRLTRSHGPSRRTICLAMLVRKKESLPILIEHLTSGTYDEKYSTLLILQKVCRWKEALPQVRTILQDKSLDEKLRLRAAATAAVLGDKESVGAIIDLYRSSKMLGAREASVVALGYLGGDAAREALEEALREENPRIRANAACALAKLGHTPPLDAIRPMLNDQAWVIRRLGVETLGYLRTEARAMLEEIAARETSPSVASEIKVSICRLETRGLRNDDLYRYLESSLNSPDRQVRLWAAERLFQDFRWEAAPILAQKYLTAKGPWCGALEMYLLWLNME